MPVATRRDPNRGANAKRTNNQGSKWISKPARLAIYIRDGFACQYCGRDLRDAPVREVTLDHLDPRSGTMCPKERRNPARLITCCLRCNSSRQDKPWTEFATGGAVDRIRRAVRRKLNLPLARAILRGDTNPAEVR